MWKFALLTMAVLTAAAQNPAADPAAKPKPAEEVYKNIQIMKGVPAARIPAVMKNLTIWLGVECTHCHVQGEFEKDDKPAKETTRKMFRMVRGIGTRILRRRQQPGHVLHLPPRRCEAPQSAAAIGAQRYSSNAFHTVLATIFAPSAVGCRPSRCIRLALPATPSRKNGISFTRYFAARSL